MHSRRTSCAFYTLTSPAHRLQAVASKNYAAEDPYRGLEIGLPLARVLEDEDDGRLYWTVGKIRRHLPPKDAFGPVRVEAEYEGNPADWEIFTVRLKGAQRTIHTW